MDRPRPDPRLLDPTIGNLFEQVYRELRPRAPMPEFDVRFFAFSNLNNTIRLRQGKILVRLSDLLGPVHRDDHYRRRFREDAVHPRGRGSGRR